MALHWRAEPPAKPHAGGACTESAKQFPLAREARVRNRPTFRLAVARNCPFFEGLACIKRGKFRVELFCFYPTLANTLLQHFLLSRANIVVANLDLGKG
jgi:hypothetical protein